MASPFPFTPLAQIPLQLSSFSHRSRSHSSTLKTTFRFVLSLRATTKRTIQIQSKLCVTSRSGTRLAEGRAEQISRNNVSSSSSEDVLNGSPPSIRESGKTIERNHAGSGSEEPTERRRVILKDRNDRAGSNFSGRKVLGSDISSRKAKCKNLGSNMDKTSSVKVLNDEVDVEDGKMRNKKAKVTSPGDTLRIGLDMCSKRGDVINAIRLYDLAKKEGIKMKQYHYAVLLYLCSSAALGMVQPAKSGSQGRSLSHMEPSQENTVVGSESLNEFAGMIKSIDPKPNVSKHDLDKEPMIGLVEKTEYKIGPKPVEEKGDGSSYGEEDLRDIVKGFVEIYPKTLDGLVQHIQKSSNYPNSKLERENGGGIQVSVDLKRIAVRKGLKIYNEMHLENTPMNEAIFTSVARMAMAFADGDLAFEMVKKMKTYGIDPKLRSYGPALAIFCGTGDIGNAFMVEKHMMEHGVHPEEPELQALLKVSLEAGNSEKVYYILHKLRTRVRQVSSATADLIEIWFASNIASKVGKTKWDHELINRAMASGGGGWHGKGWLGKGKWTVCRSSVSSDGFCNTCGEKLVTIDLDPAETESFAKSVASIASQREKNSSFQKFQKWLEYYGPFEAVVDAANVGLYSQRSFKPSKVNAVANGIRQMLPSRKFPLIVLHNRRIAGEKMDEPFNKSLIEKWKNADALYATPTGSNDDWYWLYAAIKYRCLVVTNDEMRDHLFQVLGNDFFPKWKERHQVHFSFNETGPVFRMPPPCSIVMQSRRNYVTVVVLDISTHQESGKGHWHIPIESEVESEDERIWLCCTRQRSTSAVQDCLNVRKESYLSPGKMERRRAKRQAEEVKLFRQRNGEDHCRQELEDSSASERSLKSSSALEGNYASILPQLEAAEEFGSGLIDFQI